MTNTTTIAVTRSVHRDLQLAAILHDSNTKQVSNDILRRGLDEMREDLDAIQAVKDRIAARKAA